jgi:hypothetical protein
MERFFKIYMKPIANFYAFRGTYIILETEYEDCERRQFEHICVH